MNYQILVPIHVTVVIVWIVAMFAVSVLVSSYANAGPAPDLTSLRRAQLVNRFVTGPFMILAWLLGLTLVVKGSWLGANWLSAKLVFVLILSAIHGMQAKRLRTMLASKIVEVPFFLRVAPVIIVLCALTVVWLALTKPF